MLRPAQTDQPRLTAQPQLAYLPGLDGLRALAVLAVLLYHADLRWAQGGFLGVEVFFVISGYLITTLLLGEYQRTGRIDVRQFWLRRVRRLLPAALALIIAVLTFSVFFLPAEVANVRGDALAAFFYFTNWHLIYVQRSYFEATGRPSLLQHLWSLAVEGQLYLLWPLIVRALLPRWRRRWLICAVVLGALLSSGLMALLFHPGVDPSRVYYGTDTRASGFLIGAALALLWRPEQQAMLTRLEGQLLSIAGLLGVLTLGWCVWQVNAYQSALFRGGLLWVALATAVAISALAQPSRLSGALGIAPLRYLGLRSYSIYLWHWPVYMLLRPQLDLPLASVPVLAMRLVATLALAELSYHLVEQPFRNGPFERRWNELRRAYDQRQWETLVRWAGILTTASSFGVILGWLVLHAQPPVPPPYLAVSAVNISSGITVAARATVTPPTPRPTALPTVAPTSAPHAPTAKPTNIPATAEPPTPTPAPEHHVLAIGDSVMLGAAGALTSSYSSVEVDAAVSRQAETGGEILAWRRDQGTLGDVVVIQLGNNGPLDPQQFDTMLNTVQDVPRVLVVTLKLPRPWEASNNAIIRESVAHHPNAVLVDWYSASVENYGYFWDDGMHLRPEGAAAYAGLVLANMGP